MLNVYFGGTLYQDLSLKENCQVMHNQKGSRGYPCHRIQILPNSFLETIYHQEGFVNSYHHQAIKELAPIFCVAAKSQDGVIEAFENKEKQIYAVQFHPEMMFENDLKSLAVFTQFIEGIGK